MSTALARVESGCGEGEVLAVEAQRAARVLMRKSPQTKRTYEGIYARFAAWLAAREGVPEAPVEAFTSEALVLYLDELEARCAPATVKKERPALRKLARYLHQLGRLDATVILMIEIPTVTGATKLREGLDRGTWERVLTVARARLAVRRAAAVAGGRDPGSCADSGTRRRRAVVARVPDSRGGPV